MTYAFDLGRSPRLHDYRFFTARAMVYAFDHWLCQPLQDTLDSTAHVIITLSISGVLNSSMTLTTFFTTRTIVSSLHQWRLQLLPGTYNGSCNQSVSFSASSKYMRLVLLSIGGLSTFHGLYNTFCIWSLALLKFQGVYDRLYTRSLALSTSPKRLR